MVCKCLSIDLAQLRVLGVIEPFEQNHFYDVLFKENPYYEDDGEGRAG